MTTIVNNPAPANESGGGGFLIGVMVFVVFAAVVLYFGIPLIKQMGSVQVNVPGKIDVNVTQGK
jgi:hypothetical protein